MSPDGGVRVKVCGLTVPSEAAECARLGVWGVGVVFAAGSPRRVDVERAAAVCAAVPGGVAKVGVFVASAPDVMAETARRAGLTHLQVHGDVDPAEARAASGLAVIQGIRMDGPGGVARARASAADMVLLDAAVAGRDGGTGITFDWALLDADPLGRPFALAGGLNPGNVAEAVRRTSPALVDVSSGVESAPGRKDAAKVAAFLAAVAGAVGVAA
ncbi:MAG TPA: phosphoribosylanthranilate isomerase [Miltoncostaeaceae bacterium]|jgi:phosphoribosylanthranilate isomerase|nr:phosphoribosylanthranilate isomerase [Miltoncostaeaceae bacterium]